MITITLTDLEAQIIREGIQSTYCYFDRDASYAKLFNGQEAARIGVDVEHIIAMAQACREILKKLEE